ncbi:PHB depolymerase family esterase [Halomonas sp. NO4]|uniref:prolyl oligopeptidase family serine peptidase n=1 Tax=Halomonas sp. NO4 TaxID=2484813 RepID=UPI0013D5E85A|nr:PHB depolymerase family esterase [Halomonas sp. NO4]
MRNPILLATALLASAGAWAEERPAELPHLALDDEAVSVIGVSSGGHMALQLAVAWPERFTGVGVLAAGPWSCAQGSLGQALGQCMTTRRGPPNLDALAHHRRDYQSRDQVGSDAAFADLRAFVWHGSDDKVVDPTLGEALATQLGDWLADPDAQLRVQVAPDVGHGWPVRTRDRDIPPHQLADCRLGGGTHLLACDSDVVGEALTWLHGELTPPATGADEAGELRVFDQSDFEAKGLADAGYIYVPEGCESGGCDLTLALHGCGMGVEQIGEAFVRHTGLNAWAAANDRVVLYPQAESSLANPQGCWDWWGFAESSWQLHPLHDTRDGTQVQALMAMLAHLTDSPDEE